MQVSNLFVCLMGMGVTFFGLTCLILLITLMGKIVGGKQGAEAPSAAAPAPAPVSAPAAPAAPAPVVNRQAVIAAVSAVIAEELGTDVSAIRIRSFKQIGGTAPVVAPTSNRQAMVAAVSAAIAEDLGTDVSAIRIHSFKQVA
ncbi:MAG: OadG family protein [Oscillospiraceae bacterium]|nr:OadG family protein [Oscillospiraceae bacterium]